MVPKLIDLKPSMVKISKIGFAFNFGFLQLYFSNQNISDFNKGISDLIIYKNVQIKKLVCNRQIEFKTR